MNEKSLRAFAGFSLSPTYNPLRMKIAQPDNEADNQSSDMPDDIDARLQECHDHANDNDRQHDLAQLWKCLFRVIDERAERTENTENRSARPYMGYEIISEEEVGDIRENTRQQVNRQESCFTCDSFKLGTEDEQRKHIE